MEFTSEEKQLQQEACDYVESRRNELIDTFILKKNPLRLGFITIFMAGSPGAGKTEFSREYAPIILDRNDVRIQSHLKRNGIDTASFDNLFVTIDIDEIRSFLPQYRKTDRSRSITANAHVVQKAAAKGLDILRDYCLENQISFLHDGTFSNHDTMKKLISKSIKFGREVQIFFIYLDPLSAWEFTKAREYVEGRNILKEKFIEQYFMSRENVEKIKKEFEEKVKLNCVLKDSSNKVIDIRFNIPSLDTFLNTSYNKGLISSYSRESLTKLIQ